MPSSSLSTITIVSRDDIENQHGISSPLAALHKPVYSPSAVELDELTFGSRYNGPGTPKSETYTTSSRLSTIKESSDAVERDSPSSGPSSPTGRRAVSLVPSFWFPAMNKWRVLSACLTYCCNGLIDSAAGAIIPYMEKQYRIGYATVSLIFVTQAIGFIMMAFVVDPILHWIGRARLLILAEVTLLIGSLMILCNPPFGVLILAYFLFGLGEATNIALNNVFCANLANPTMILGAAHGSYGIGGILGPIVATTLVSHGSSWNKFFAITLAIRVLTIIGAGWSFWGYETESDAHLVETLELTASRRDTTESNARSKMQLLWHSIKNRSTITGAIFIFAYQGAEVSISGWVISFLISYRHGAPQQVGYVTAGFWGGITAGRFLLPPLCRRLTEKRSVYILGALAVAFEIMVWFVPNVIGDAVAVSIVGLVLGPVYPCGQTVFMRLLPRQLQVTSLSFISSAGSSGGAIAPFLTGLIAQKYGTWVLHPICVSLFAVMLTAWFLLPKVQRRND